MAHRLTWYLTAALIEMLNGLENLQQVSELYQYDTFNLLSCMTIDAVSYTHSEPTRRTSGSGFGCCGF